MTVLITGAKGQLGNAFQNFFAKNSIEFYATDSTIDITELEMVRNFVKDKHIKVIINCAAYNDVDKAECEWKKAYKINGMGPRNLAIVANEIGATLVHYSTDYVFDGKKGKSYSIIDKPNPMSKYGESKLLGEQNVRDIATKFLLIRVSWLFGKGSKNFIRKVIKWSENQDSIKVVIDQIASPTYTVDLVKATYELLKKQTYGLFHITNSGYCSRYELAKYVLDLIGWKGKLKQALSSDFETDAKRPVFSVLDNYGLEEVSNFSMPHWKDAVKRYLQEEKII